MTWTIVDSCGLDAVPKFLASGQAFFAFRELQIGGYGPSHASSSQPDLSPSGTHARSEPLNSLLFPACEQMLSDTTHRNDFFESSAADSVTAIITEAQ